MKPNDLQYEVDPKDIVALKAGKLDYTSNTNCPMARAVRSGLGKYSRVRCFPRGVTIKGQFYKFDRRGQAVSECLARMSEYNQTRKRNFTFGLKPGVPAIANVSN